MRILLTGGCGNLGRVLSRKLLRRGTEVRLLDLQHPASDQGGEFIQGSVLDRDNLKLWFLGCDVIVHIAAWHGIHEFKKEKHAYDFFDLNIRGTFEVFEAAVTADVSKVVFISSTSVDAPDTVYGHSKIIAEQTATFYANHHKMKVITLRPRAFIPHWNRAVYASYLDWVNWFWKGAVHIDDVAQAVERSIDFLNTNSPSPNLILTVDGAYEYSDEDLKNWNKAGSGTSFKQHYEEFFKLAKSHGLPVDQAPRKLDITKTCELIGYSPQFSLRNVLSDLATFGQDGPPDSPSHCSAPRYAQDYLSFRLKTKF